MTVQNATFEDMALAADIMVTSFRAAFADFVSPKTLDACTKPENCRAMLEHSYKEGRMHFLMGSGQGFLCWQETDDGAEIVAIHSLPESWGTGLGHALLAEAIRMMQQEAFAALLETYRDYDISPATEPLEKIRWKISHPGSYYYWILVGDQTVGAIRVWDAKDGSRKRISPLYIMPDFRGRGYAQAAMLEAERIHGTTLWQLDTILQEAGNCHLYEKMGYHQTGHKTVIQENMTIVDYEKD